MTGTMLPPDVVRWVSRNGEDGDCAIAAIALATGNTYETVLAESIAVRPGAIRGMNWRDIKAVVARLGFSYRLRRKYDIEEDTGILDCKRGREEHVVYLWAGRILEPDMRRRMLWRDPEAFLANEGWTAGQLLTIRKS